ncbi:MAG: tetratricopeptide repeat protein [Gemmatimonadaceae bacterium]
MRRSLWLVFGVVVVGAAAWAGSWGASASASERDALADASFDEIASAELAARDTQIAVWRIALGQDPVSAIALGQLAGLHLQRSREGGGWRDILTAESYARRSWRTRQVHNGAAAATLVATLVAQHRFAAADSIATALVAREPDVPEYRAILGEIAMELGDDARAAAAFAASMSARYTPSVAPRLARWHELRGDVHEARRLLTNARDSMGTRHGVPDEVRAWYALRLGELERRASRPRRAARVFRGGLALRPGDPRILAAMTRLAADRAAPRDVITWGERAIAAELDPEVLLLLATAYGQLGRADEAARARDAFEVATSVLGDAPFHRAWSLLLLDRGERVAEQLQRAEREVSERGDVYALDFQAWALQRSGRNTEARVAMQQALRMGTRDPLLERHRREIEALP